MLRRMRGYNGDSLARRANLESLKPLTPPALRAILSQKERVKRALADGSRRGEVN